MADRKDARLFRRVCTIAGALYVLLSANILISGVESSLAPFGVPPEALASPHYEDAIVWTYTHMLVLGSIIIFVGRRVESPRAQRTFAHLMIAAHAVYLYLDVRTSDTPLGNALYKGPASAMPAAIVLVMLLAFVVVAIVQRRGRAPDT
jgi:hypothetical protein